MPILRRFFWEERREKEAAAVAVDASGNTEQQAPLLKGSLVETAARELPEAL